MDVRTSSSAALFEMLGQFRRVWIKGGWSWDTRFTCVASSFNVEMEGEARAAVLRFLSSEWTQRNVATAPAPIRDIAEMTGGVRPDQRMFTGDLSGRLIAFGLWWPWGDEITISLRIGISGYVREPDVVRLRETFGTMD